VNPNGSPIQLTKTGDSAQGKPGARIRLAESELAKMRTKAAGGTAPNGSDTLGQLIDAWLKQCDGRLSATTMREYRRIAARVVIPGLGEIKLSKLSAKHLARLYAKLEAKDNVATTIRGVHALIGLHCTRGRTCP